MRYQFAVRSTLVVAWLALAPSTARSQSGADSVAVGRVIGVAAAKLLRRDRLAVVLVRDTAVSVTAAAAFEAALRTNGVRLLSAGDLERAPHASLAALSFADSMAAEAIVSVEQCDPTSEGLTWSAGMTTYHLVRTGGRWRVRGPVRRTVADGFCHR